MGFSISPKNTLTCRLEKLGIKPPTPRLIDNPLYILSYSCPICLSDSCMLELLEMSDCVTVAPFSYRFQRRDKLKQN